jgi:16S rRNA (adenine1518-N6/adenine1519-N6)-dimethyltransferase
MRSVLSGGVSSGRSRGAPVVVRLGQNFLADPNLLAAIVREARLAPDDVVLEVGGGEGALTAELAPRVATVHVIELDRGLGAVLELLAAKQENVRIHIADALRIDLTSLTPAPTIVVSNLPYSIATPLIVRTIEELAEVRSWTVMVQREIADRLRAAPGSREYGGPSVLVQLACDVRLLRTVDRAVFRPRPRVDSALLRLERRGPAAPPEVARLVRDAFAHRRKTLAASLALAGDASWAGGRDAVRAALVELGLAPEARAEDLAPEQFVRLAEHLRAHSPGGGG